MKQWEYYTDGISDDEYALQYEIKDLNQKGKEGWELISVVYHADWIWYYFKREITADNLNFHPD